MNQFQCPNCKKLSNAKVSNISYSLPPTGGDYDWMETSAKVTCADCNNTYEARVKVDLESQNVEEIVRIYK